MKITKKIIITGALTLIMMQVSSATDLPPADSDIPVLRMVIKSTE